MTAYQGGKNRLGKKIYQKILELEEEYKADRGITSTLPYFEPFVGMCGVLRHFSATFTSEGSNTTRKLYACDSNEDLILLWQDLQKGWVPPEDVTLEMYELYKASEEHSSTRGFIGTACSYAGSYFSGFRGKYDKKINYAKLASDRLCKMGKMLNNVTFLDSCSYDQFDPKNYLIYCDPPYLNNNVPSKYFQKFDHSSFWQEMEEWSKSNLVIVSERVAPENWVKVWSEDHSVNFRKNGKNVKRNIEECLFVYYENCKSNNDTILEGIIEDISKIRLKQN